MAGLSRNSLAPISVGRSAFVRAAASVRHPLSHKWRGSRHSRTSLVGLSLRYCVELAILLGKFGTRSLEPAFAGLFVVHLREAPAHIRDDLPNLLARALVLKRGHVGAELLAAFGDCPQQILIDGNRSADHVGEQSR